MNRFLIRAWVYPYYRSYAGLLFVLFLFAAGLLRGEEHLNLALFFTSNVYNLIYPTILFVLYEFLSIHFSVKYISNYKNRFIREILFKGFKKRFVILLQMVFYLHAPVILYTLFLSGVALFNKRLPVLLLIILLAFFRLATYTLILNRYILFPLEKQFKRIFRIHLPVIVDHPLIMMSLRYFYSDRFLSLILSKILSLGSLLLFIVFFSTIDDYVRFSAVAIFIVFISNAFIPLSLFRFYNKDLYMFRNLPLKPWLILGQLWIVMIILSLPEVVIIYRNFSGVIDIASISLHIIHGLAVLLFLYTYLIFSKIELKLFIFRIFYGSLVFIIIFLFAVPVYLLIILLGLCTYYFYLKGFYTYELIYERENKA